LEKETRVRRFDGEYRWFLSRACPLFDRMGNILGWSGNDTDIDDRKQAEEKLRLDETELRRITDAIPQAITVLGPEGNASTLTGWCWNTLAYSRGRRRRST